MVVIIGTIITNKLYANIILLYKENIPKWLNKSLCIFCLVINTNNITYNLLMVAIILF